MGTTALSMLVITAFVCTPLAVHGASETYPAKALQEGRVNESKAASWDVTDLNKARGKGKPDEDLDALLHWAIGEAQANARCCAECTRKAVTP